MSTSGDAFPVDIDPSQSVGHLKDAIKAKNPATITCDAKDLEVFLARTKDSAWLASNTDDVRKMKQGQVTAATQKLMEEDKKLHGEYDLQRVLAGMPPPKSEEIHVLVRFPKSCISGIAAAFNWMNKRQRTLWTTTHLDLSTSTLPDVNDCNKMTCRLNATTISGFGILCLSDELMVFCRTDVVQQLNFMQNDVLRDGACGYVLGPSGMGKSTTAVAFALTLACTEWVVTWVNLKRGFTPGQKKTVALSERYREDSELNLILNSVEDAKKHVVFLDGFTQNNVEEEEVCTSWLWQNRTNRRLVVVTSMSARGKSSTDQDKVMKIYEHFVSS
ncbi:hypothetical protein PsorP6_003179 [Peronosclerospora sorghi]|uniref:Uncharacterized protein n=1 Tax=Peronosclerospora sorghi TaxID=230839 RepID=A0ACC0VME5_9STRA|nr:hypothetical protein PsorP6_003179 [Peronosclerospora sorghi]